jgi:general secretion pathway protein G
MTELIFVVVVIGILAAVALPKVGGSVKQAQIASARADVMALRSAILNERQKRLMRGENSFIAVLSSNSELFGGDSSKSNYPQLFKYPKQSANASGKWRGSAGTYYFKVDATDVTFTYDSTNGTFKCDPTSDYCKEITK